MAPVDRVPAAVHDHGAGQPHPPVRRHRHVHRRRRRSSPGDCRSPFRSSCSRGSERSDVKRRSRPGAVVGSAPRSARTASNRAA
jgi:hypothetical protein